MLGLSAERSSLSVDINDTNNNFILQVAIFSITNQSSIRPPFRPNLSTNVYSFISERFVVVDKLLHAKCGRLYSYVSCSVSKSPHWFITLWIPWSCRIFNCTLAVIAALHESCFIQLSTEREACSFIMNTWTRGNPRYVTQYNSQFACVCCIFNASLTHVKEKKRIKLFVYPVKHFAKKKISILLCIRVWL